MDTFTYADYTFEKAVVDTIKIKFMKLLLKKALGYCIIIYCIHAAECGCTVTEETMLFDEEMMLLAIEQAKTAYSAGEIPVGAVIVDNEGSVVSVGYNMREKEKNPLLHAEIVAIQKAAVLSGAAEKSNGWRLSDCTLYVTLEPCPMCAGAIMNSRLKRVVYGAFDEKGGALSSVINLFDYPFNHRPLIRSGILKDECAQLLTDFFAELRKKQN